MQTLVTNIKQLVQVETSPRRWVAGADMARLESVRDAYLLAREGRIAAFGAMSELDEERVYGEETVREIDASGRLVLPAFCDSHTHLVYAGSREIEYIDKIRGLSYEEIARRG
ncbi:MAG: imidazolonepropionase, partial [Odoribacteraceae bacterium]|nr:imidazolonepropionase [Odoribacteraceae bacterium]